MRILLYGSRGWIGSKVVKLLQSMDHTVIKGQVRTDNKEAVEYEIVQVNPTHVMCFIGRTHGQIGDKVYSTIDYLEQPGKIRDNVRDNLFSPMILGLLCVKYNIHLTYLGTGCIFQYDEDHPYGREINGYRECDKPNFFDSAYSTVKGFTDELLHLLDNNVLNIRIRMPITDEDHSRNFITKITTYEKICNIPNSMTVLNDLLPIIIDLASNKKTGTFNLTNPGLISHNEILQMYKEIVDFDFEWINFTVKEQELILDSGRSNNFLDTTLLQELYPNIKHIKESVRDILHTMKNNRNEQY